jgi:hypothetical protein
MKKGLTAGLLIVLGFIAGAAFAAAVVLYRWWTPDGTRFDLSQPAVVHQVRQLQRLETVVFAMDKVISGGYESRYLPRFVAGDNLLLLVYGDVTAGVDLGRVEAGAVSIKGRAVSLRLPPSEVFSTRLDNERTRVYSRQTGLFTPVNPGLESEVRREAERQIRQAALEGGILRTATLNASTTLKSFLQGLGFERVEIGESPSLP